MICSPARARQRTTATVFPYLGRGIRAYKCRRCRSAAVWALLNGPELNKMFENWCRFYPTRCKPHMALLVLGVLVFCGCGVPGVAEATVVEEAPDRIPLLALFRSTPSLSR